MSRLARAVVLVLALALLIGSSRPVLAQRPDREVVQQLKQEPKAYLDVVGSYLDMVQQLAKMADDPRLTLIVVQHDMKELYGQQGATKDAIKEFRRMLKDIKDPPARAMLRFAIVDLYKELDQPQKALEELRGIAAETTARLQERE